MEEKKKKSWKTTIAGVLAALAVIAAMGGKALEGGLEQVNWTELVGALGVLAAAGGLLFSRDDDVNSEGGTAKKSQ